MCSQSVEDDADDSDESDTTFKISKLADVIHALFRIYGTDFYPYFDQILPHFIKMLVSPFANIATISESVRFVGDVRSVHIYFYRILDKNGPIISGVSAYLTI